MRPEATVPFHVDVAKNDEVALWRQLPFCMKQPLKMDIPPFEMVVVAFDEMFPFTAKLVPGAVVAIPSRPLKPSIERIGSGFVVDDVVAKRNAFTMFGMVVVDDEAKVMSTPEKRSWSVAVAKCTGLV